MFCGPVVFKGEKLTGESRFFIWEELKNWLSWVFLIPRIGIEHLKQQGGAYDVVRNCGSFRIYGFCLDKN